MGCRPYTDGLGMFAPKAEEEGLFFLILLLKNEIGIAIVENIVTLGSGHVNYGAIPSIIYT